MGISRRGSIQVCADRVDQTHQRCDASINRKWFAAESDHGCRPVAELARNASFQCRDRHTCGEVPVVERKRFGQVTIRPNGEHMTRRHGDRMTAAPHLATAGERELEEEMTYL